MRRRSVLPDSLELLLDTICNMFGGVVFIALLIVMTLRTNVQDVSENETNASAAALESMLAETAVMKTDLERLQNARERQRDLLAEHVPPDLEHRLNELSSLSQRHDELVKRASDLQEDNVSRLSSLQQQQDRLTHSEQELQILRQQEATLTRELQEGIQRETVRFPLARPVVSRGIQVSLRYGRVYFRHDLQLLKSDIAAPNDVDYLILADDAGSVTVTPKPTSGLPVDGNPRLAADLARKLRGFSPSDWHIAICTWPDSFGSFQSLREAITQAGYRYSVTAADSAIQDRGGEIRPGH